MAKSTDVSARNTPDLITGKVQRGRTPKPDSLTNAQRQAKFRAERLQVKVGARMASTVRALADEFDVSIDDVARALLQYALCNRNWRQSGVHPWCINTDD